MYTCTCSYCLTSFESPKNRKYCTKECYWSGKRVSEETASLRTIYRRRSERGETQQKRTFDEGFFSQWSNDLAWLIGLIWADGYLQRNTVEICSKDNYLIEMVETLIGMRDGITTKNRGRHFRIVFTSKSVADFLRGVGLHQAKSFTIEWPNIPKEFEAAFVRGFFDGDGWITVPKERPGQQVPDLQAGFCSASKKFIDALHTWLEINKVTCTVRKTKLGLYKIDVVKQSSLINLYHLMYPNKNYELTLFRKHSPFRQWLITPRARAGRKNKSP